MHFSSLTRLLCQPALSVPSKYFSPKIAFCLQKNCSPKLDQFKSCLNDLFSEFLYLMLYFLPESFSTTKLLHLKCINLNYLYSILKSTALDCFRNFCVFYAKLKAYFDHQSYIFRHFYLTLAFLFLSREILLIACVNWSTGLDLQRELFICRLSAEMTPTQTRKLTQICPTFCYSKLNLQSFLAC